MPGADLGFNPQPKHKKKRRKPALPPEAHPSHAAAAAVKQGKKPRKAPSYSEFHEAHQKTVRRQRRTKRQVERLTERERAHRYLVAALMRRSRSTGRTTATDPLGRNVLLYQQAKSGTLPGGTVVDRAVAQTLKDIGNAVVYTPAGVYEGGKAVGFDVRDIATGRDFTPGFSVPCCMCA
jgi:hypothetical protein